MFPEIHSGITALLAQFIPTSPARLGDTQVNGIAHPKGFSRVLNHAPDVLVHRQLSAAISHAPLHASLHSKDYVEKTLGNVNRRHRMAQMASRASIEFYVGLALQARGDSEIAKGGTVTEEAFVIRTFRNGVAVFVHR